MNIVREQQMMRIINEDFVYTTEATWGEEILGTLVEKNKPSVSRIKMISGIINSSNSIKML